MTRTTLRAGLAVGSLTAIALAAAPATAHHWWGGYAWSYNGGELSMPVVDNTSGVWNAHVSQAVNDWNASTVIQAPLEYGNNASCSMVTGTIQVCNSDYGATGWLGIATISISGGTIVAGSTKLNDNYFNRDAYNNYTWRQLVTCQEIGHDYGLAHQNENFSTDETTSCMEYTSRPEGNEGPDAHDYEQLLTIYGGSGDGGGDTGDGGGGKGGKGGGKGGGKPDGTGGGKGKNRVALPAVGNTPSSWGRPVDYLPNGKPHVFVREANGIKFVTHVTWAPDEGDHGDYHH